MNRFDGTRVTPRWIVVLSFALFAFLDLAVFWLIGAGLDQPMAIIVLLVVNKLLTITVPVIWYTGYSGRTKRWFDLCWEFWRTAEIGVWGLLVIAGLLSGLHNALWLILPLIFWIGYRMTIVKRFMKLRQLQH